MRCTECGYVNPPNVSTCVHCGISLEKASPAGNQADPVVPSQGAELKGTIKGTPDQAVDEKGRSTIRQSDEISHPSSCKCGYPVRPGMSKCPKCGQSLTLSDPVPYAEKRSPTIDPYRSSISPKCRLVVIPRDNEEKETAVNIEGYKVALNREMLEPDNNTISSSVQAELECIDGEWFITDRSSLETTFVLTKSAIKLNRGDIVLIGNRKFRFEG